MDENPSLSEAVFLAISNWLAADDEQTMLTGFVLSLTGIGEDGLNFYQTVVPDNQPRPLTLGMIGIADETVREDLRTDFMLSRIEQDPA